MSILALVLMWLAVSTLIYGFRRGWGEAVKFLAISLTLGYTLTYLSGLNPKPLLTYINYFSGVYRAAALIMLARSLALTLLNIIGFIVFNPNVVDLAKYIYGFGLNAALGYLTDPVSQILRLILYASQLAYTSTRLILTLHQASEPLIEITLLILPLIAVSRFRPIAIPILSIALPLALIPSLYLGFFNVEVPHVNLANLTNALQLLGSGSPILIRFNAPYMVLVGNACGVGYVAIGESYLAMLSNSSQCPLTINSAYLFWLRINYTYSVAWINYGDLPTADVDVKPQVNYLVNSGYVVGLWMWLKEPDSYRLNQSGGNASVEFLMNVHGVGSAVMWAYVGGVGVKLISVSGNLTCRASRSKVSLFAEMPEGMLASINGSEYAVYTYYTMYQVDNLTPTHPTYVKPPSTRPVGVHQLLVNVTCIGNGTVEGLIGLHGSWPSRWGQWGIGNGGRVYSIALTTPLEQYLSTLGPLGALRGFALSIVKAPYALFESLVESSSIIGFASALLVVALWGRVASSIPLRLIDELRSLATYLAPGIWPTRLIGMLVRRPRIGGRLRMYSRLSSMGLLGSYISSGRAGILARAYVEEAAGIRAVRGSAAKGPLRFVEARPLGDGELANVAALGRRYWEFEEFRRFLRRRLVRIEARIYMLYEAGILDARDARRRLMYWFTRSISEYRSRYFRLRPNIRLALDYLTSRNVRRVVLRMLEAGGEALIRNNVVPPRGDYINIASIIASALSLNMRALQVLRQMGLLKVDLNRLEGLMEASRHIASPWWVNYTNALKSRVFSIYRPSGLTLRLIESTFSRLREEGRGIVRHAARIRVAGASPGPGIEYRYSRYGRVNAYAIPLIKAFVLDSTNLRELASEYMRKAAEAARKGTLVNYAYNPLTYEYWGVLRDAYRSRPMDLFKLSALLRLHPLTLVREVLANVDRRALEAAVRRVLAQRPLDEEYYREVKVALTEPLGSARLNMAYGRFLRRVVRGDAPWIRATLRYSEMLIDAFKEAYGVRRPRHITKGPYLNPDALNEYRAYLTVRRLMRLIKDAEGRYLKGGGG